MMRAGDPMTIHVLTDDDPQGRPVQVHVAGMAPRTLGGAVILSLWTWLALLGAGHLFMWATGLSRGALI